jgi:hypothetical protein
MTGRTTFYSILLIGMISVPLYGGSLIINEIMQNPEAVGDTAGEWFELYNTTASAIDIDGWTISDDGSNSHVINNGGPLPVPAGGYFVLGNNGDSVTNGGLTVDYVYSSFSLGNTDDEIVLTDTSAVEIDRVNYDGGPNFPNPAGASMALLFSALSGDPMTDNDLGANWEAATIPYGAGDFGTPGSANIVPEPSTFNVLALGFIILSMARGRRTATK